MNHTDQYTGHHAWDGTGYGWAIVEAHRQRSQAFHDIVFRPAARASGFVLEGLRRLFRALTAYRRRVHTQRELHSLSDHLLRDIGLTRSEIPYVAARLAAGGDDGRRVDTRLVEGRLEVTHAGKAANDDLATYVLQGGRQGAA